MVLVPSSFFSPPHVSLNYPSLLLYCSLSLSHSLLHPLSLSLFVSLSFVRASSKSISIVGASYLPSRAWKLVFFWRLIYHTLPPPPFSHSLSLSRSLSFCTTSPSHAPFRCANAKQDATEMAGAAAECVSLLGRTCGVLQ